MAPRNRDWDSLAAGTRRRWVGAFGGPRSLSPDARTRRAGAAYQSGASLPAAHTGHAAPYDAVFAGLATTSGLRDVIASTYNDRHRAAQYARDQRLLNENLLDPAAFRRRWSRRVRRVGDDELESDPARVLELMRRSGPPPDPFYRRRRRPSGGTA